MTEDQVRSKVVGVMQSWVGARKGDIKHMDIVNTYNSHRPLARGYAIKPTDDYCAATISAAWIKSGTVSVAVTEVSAPKIVTLAQQAGIWVENDAYIPKPGDAIAYDWDDVGGGDNRGSADHVGIVEKVENGVITVIEGNMSGGIVGRRNIQVDGRYIRGFICPRYSALADKPGHWEKENHWVYLDADGKKKIGWLKDNEKWYYLGNDGVMRTGWVKVDGKWYYLNSPGGDMATGWLKLDNKWYLLGKDGAMKTGWQQVGEKWYYLFDDGHMAADEWVDNGKSYVDASGAWVPGKTK